MSAAPRVPAVPPSAPVAPRSATEAATDTPEAARAQVARIDAEFAQLRARAAEIGFQLHVVDDHGAAIFVLTRWGRFIEHPDLAGVEHALDRVEGK